MRSTTVRETRSYSICRKLVIEIDKLSARANVARSVYFAAIVFFLLIIVTPAIAGIVFRLATLSNLTLSVSLIHRMIDAVAWSFVIGVFVSLLDVLAGVPLAWLIVRRHSRMTTIIDSLADIPFVIPTVALGFAVVEFWSGSSGVSSIFRVDSLISPGSVLIVLLHFAFSYPIIVRVMVGEFLNYRETYEVAARTLGASAFTAVRTITIPILRLGLLAAFLLAFARSLSETGATIVVAGAFENGTVFIKNAQDAGLTTAVVMASLIMIITSLCVFTLIKIISPKLRLGPLRVRPSLERTLSTNSAVRFRNVLSLSVFLIFVLGPCLFIALPAIQAVSTGALSEAVSGVGPWKSFWSSVLLSYVVAFLVTIINIIAGLPIAVLIARNRMSSKIVRMIDALVDLPIVVPSLALGVSLNFFWGSMGSLPEFWVLIIAHSTITYSYFVRAMSASVQGIPLELEESARTLGALPLRIFRKITLPLTKYSILSGAILMFTRSVDETGATSAVSKVLKTAPLLLVDWIRGTVQVTSSQLALGVGFLVLTSFLALLALRLITFREPRKD